MQLKPFFRFFGSKYQATWKYTEPKYNVIIEPFAGSAGYSLNYSDREVFLYDADPIICGVWEYLINVSTEEILSLPDVFFDLDCKLFNNICKEAKDLMGFCVQAGAVKPNKHCGISVILHPRRMSFWSYKFKERLASQLQFIRHWKVSQLSFEQIDFNGEYTWFIDPPYQLQKVKYDYNNIDYKLLNNFCTSREGQVIVCEQSGADWLPFEHLDSRVNQKRKHINEVIWCQN